MLLTWVGDNWNLSSKRRILFGKKKLFTRNVARKRFLFLCQFFNNSKMVTILETVQKGCPERTPNKNCYDHSQSKEKEQKWSDAENKHFRLAQTKPHALTRLSIETCIFLLLLFYRCKLLFIIRKLSVGMIKFYIENENTCNAILPGPVSWDCLVWTECVRSNLSDNSLDTTNRFYGILNLYSLFYITIIIVKKSYIETRFCFYRVQYKFTYFNRTKCT